MAKISMYLKRKINLWQLFRIVLILGICFVILKPIFIKIIRGIMTKEDLHDLTVVYVPKNLTLENIKIVWQLMKYPLSFLFTLRLSLMVAILQIISCSVVAYGFARYKFKFREVWFLFVILTLIVPQQMTSISQYLNYRFFDYFGISYLFGLKKANLVNTNWPFIFSSIFAVGYKNGIYILMLRQVFRAVPKETEDAALVDGASQIKIFFRIMLPGAVPVIVTVALFSFVWQWTDIFYTGWFFSGGKTLAAALSGIFRSYFDYYVSQSIYGTDLNYVSVLSDIGALLMMMPLIILYIVFQKYFIEGVEHSGIIG